MTAIAKKMEAAFARGDAVARERAPTPGEGERRVRQFRSDPAQMVLREMGLTLARHADTLDQYVVALMEQVDALENRIAVLEGR